MTNEEHEDLIRATVMNFCDDIARRTEDQVKAWPNGDKLMGLARALCDAAGPYPAQDGSWRRITLGLAGGQIAYDVKKTAALQMPIRPAWWHFLREAQVAIQYLGSDVTKEKAADFMAEVRRAAQS